MKMDSGERLKYLFECYLQNSCSEAEFNELIQLMNRPELEDEIKKLIGDQIELADTESPGNSLSRLRAEEIFQQVLHPGADTIITSIKSTSWQHLKNRMWAAAIILLVIGSGTILLLSRTMERKQLAKINTTLSSDINPPSSTRAMLTLSDGRQIFLDSADNDKLTMQGNTSITKVSDDQVVYKGEASSEIQYNTLTVPRGGKIINIILSDGSRVWLNSGSSLKYPVAFTRGERKVEMTGEAYFEVSHNAALPFKVQHGETLITDLGTHFNINAYEDEAATKVTLLEGAVKINNGLKSPAFLRPGQQAAISTGIAVGNNVNIKEVMAWKDGRFEFGEATDISEIMKQLSRWYNVDVEYEQPAKGHIGGAISRDIPISQVLKMLEMTGSFSFRVEGKKVIVQGAEN
jgi:transmembrane sensor